ncbi:Pf77 protein [Babesia caballi]|uniref:Pf77 protein n=1 Tax=Babesia caballi TaxID=5871 RepID=A0AAV4LR99_BABCB|nr:Pf77 protein [Babesia caballi]
MMSQVSHELPLQQQQSTVHAAPMVKTCCMPGDGTIPITIPVYSPVYQGNHVLSGNSGIIPQQQCVFTSPLAKNQTAYQTHHIVQPVYEIQNAVFDSKPQGGVFCDQPLNITHYLWKQTPEPVEPLKKAGTFDKLRTIFNWQETTDFGEVKEGEEAKDFDTKTTDGEKSQDEESSEQGAEERVQKTKKQPMCGFFTSCCMNNQDVAPLESATTNIYRLNTLFRENTMKSEAAGGCCPRNVSRVSSIISEGNASVNQVGSVMPQSSINSQHGVVPQTSIHSQHGVVTQYGVVPQSSIHSEHGVITQNGMVPQSSICSQHGPVQQGSIASQHSLNSQGGLVQQSSIQSNATVNTNTPYCFSCLPRTVPNHVDAVVPMTSIQSQASIPVNATEAGCFATCCGQSAINNLATLATQGSFGLRNLFTMNPALSQSTMVPTSSIPLESISRQISAVSLQPSVREVVPQQPQPVFNAACVQQQRCTMKPKTFKLHAVEVHQFVPLPNMPAPKFVENVAGMNQTGAPVFQHGYGIQHPNCFFNPNTTGHVAPVIRDVMEGVTNPKIPHMYSMDSERSCQAVRLQTEEAQITPRYSSKSSIEPEKEQSVESQGEQ